MRSKSNAHVIKLPEKLRSKNVPYEGTEISHGNPVTEECKKALSSGRNQRLVNEEVKCDMRVRLNYLLKDV